MNTRLTNKKIDEILKKHGFRNNTAYSKISKYSPQHDAYLFYFRYSDKNELKDFARCLINECDSECMCPMSDIAFSIEMQ